jgi:hypothetical protein
MRREGGGGGRETLIDADMVVYTQTKVILYDY